MRELNVIGLNSGTSMDGIDAALFRIGPRKGGGAAGNGSGVDLQTELVQSVLHPFEPLFQRKLQATVAAASISWQQVCLLNTALGEVFADAAMALIKSSRNRVDRVDLIGSHGQTIWHAPTPSTFWGVSTAGTLQLGEPAVIAARTGIPVVGDFRTADVAVGGEGAPLVCFADEVLFGRDHIPTGVLNIGGIANLTVLDHHGQAIMAFDTGPGNMLIDRAADVLTGKQFDEGGRAAAAGAVDSGWLAELISAPYFLRVPPKTTGRELFGIGYADKLLEEAKRRGLSTSDILATLTAFTAQSIAQNYKAFVQPHTRIQRLIVGGGGADNQFLMRLLKQYFPHDLTISRHEEHGISTKFKEALLFALLAYTTFFKIPNNVPACTGASRKVCLGKLVNIPVGATIGSGCFPGIGKRK
jgi:anhydro-N-acetylmuramic acid kinase